MFDFDQVMKLIKAVSESTLTEFEFEDDDASFTLKKREIIKEIPRDIIKEKEVPIMMPVPMQVAPMPHPVPPMAPVQQAPAVAQTQMSAPAAQVQSQVEVEINEKYKVVKSPLVGTFYCSASPDAEPFVKVGDKVTKGQVLGIIEAMKLMNDIESDFDGEIVEILVNNKDMVEFEQPLFKIK